MEIDYIVPMVFEDDVLWQKDFMSANNTLRYTAGNNVRYRSWGTEHLLVRCIRKFMPFVRTIYIILARESQKKEWMETEGVKVVYHKDIIPKEYLPVFSSCTIEMFIPYIKGLSEYFIYGNDDMFPLAPMKETDFFMDGKPVQKIVLKDFPLKPNTFHLKCRRQQALVARAFGKEVPARWLYTGHGLAAMLKSDCLEAQERLGAEIRKGITRQRSVTSYNQYLYILWQYYKGDCHEGMTKNSYVSVKNTFEEVGDRLRNANGVVCVNDNECANDIRGYAALVRKIINDRLMNKNEDYKIYVSYHDDELVRKHGLHEDAHHVLYATHKDIDGKNINYMNPVYSEMVTMWYVWKNNKKSEYVGFEHYRRHLTVTRLPKKGECLIYRALTFDTTLYEQYAKCHNGKDMDLMISVLEKRYGKSNKYVAHIKNGHLLVANCCFLMKWADFKAMCKYLFPLLEDFAAMCGISCTDLKGWRKKAEKDFFGIRTTYQMRVLSFLAERLISAWICTHMNWWNGINVAIVHYNTPELTEAAIKSLNKCTPGCRVTVFDNSDENPFVNTFQNVSVIDNTKGQVVDFDEMLSHYPERQDDDRNKSNFGSAKHTRSVDALMDLLPDGFILMDSDVLVSKDIRNMLSVDAAVAGTYQLKEGVGLVQPFLCWINVPILKASGVRYFNGDKMWALSNKYPNNRYDTGAWLFEELKTKGLYWRQMNIWQYIIHLGHGSWRDKNIRKWLNEHKNLY